MIKCSDYPFGFTTSLDYLWIYLWINLLELFKFVTMSESEVKAGLEESLPERETSKSINGIKEHTSKEIIQNGETNKIIANGDIEMRDLSENKEQNLDSKSNSNSNDETEQMDVSEKSPSGSEKDLVNGSESDERDKLKENQQSSSSSSSDSVNSSVNINNEKEFNKESAETESDKSTNNSSEKETKDPSTSDDKLNNVDDSEKKSNSETKSLQQRTPKKDDDDDDDLQITGEVIKDNGSDIEMIEESDPLAISESDAKKIQQKEVASKDPNVIIIDTNTLLKNQGNLAAAVAASAPPATTPTSSNVNIQAAAMAAAVAATGAMPTQQGLQSAYMNALQQDDAYVIEAPSFIVPYVMEGKPKEPIKKFLNRINKDLEEFEKKDKKTTEEKKENEAEDKEKKGDDKNEESEEKSKKSEENKESDTPDKDETKKDNETEAKPDTKESDSVDKESEDSENSNSNSNSETRTEGDDDKENKQDSDSVVDLEKEEKKEEEKKEEKKEDLSHLGRWEPYYKSALGNFFLDLGLNQAQEFLQADLMRMQKRKLDKMKTTPPKEAQFALKMLERQLNSTKTKNKHLHVPLKTCKFCNFRTESELVMERHLESPHMVNYTYKCNFCEFETRGPQVILFHMEAEHNVRGRLERAPAFFQCSLCPYEDNNKSKMTRHSFSCAKKFKPEKNCELIDWEPPAKIPKVHRGRPNTLGKAFEPVKMPNLLPKGLANMLPQNINLNNLNLQQATNLINSAVAQGRGRGRPVGSYKGPMPTTRGGMPGRGGVLSPGMSSSLMQQQVAAAQQQMNQMYQQQQSGRVPRILPSQQSASSVSLLPGLGASSSITIQSVGNKGGAGKSPQQPSISITPLPRGGSQPQPAKSSSSGAGASATPTRDASGKPSFVICEICDGYIKDLEQLRNHMNLIHKVKIHPKMIYNRPPLNCQKCQHRFFTDQGLERHLLGTHGLVTSSMQEAANKGKDAGRCPICGKVFQWKLLNHVSRDHKMTLKPAHLSYKCTVCTATFNMYRLFENHVYSAHSVVNKNKGDGSKKQSATAAQ